MGTNFYFNTGKKTRYDDYANHIGKRSAAGLYCWDCDITLCKKGDAYIHNAPSASTMVYSDTGWHTRCPKCLSEPIKESLASNTAGRELGFNKKAPARKQGVASCSSFTWATSPEQVFKKLSRSKRAKTVINEYGDLFTVQEFQAILAECPVQYTDSIGHNFS